MFSATMPAKIQQMANNILNNPIEVKLAVSKPADKIIQTAYICYENQNGKDFYGVCYFGNIKFIGLFYER